MIALVHVKTVEDVELSIGMSGLFTRGQYDKYGPQWAARRLLQVIWRDRPHILQHCTVDTRDLPFVDAARDIAWRRELTEAMIGWYVHHFDKNGDYLAAMRGMYTGIGDPTLVEPWDDYETLRPGIYSVVWSTGSSPFDGHSLPYIIEPGQEWVTKDMLLFARRQGYEVHIIKAWVFHGHARVLDEYAARLWAARQALRDIDKACSDKMKMIAVAGNGAWNWNQSARPGLEWIHSNWWCDTIARAKERVLANLVTYGQPLLINDIDGIYYASRNPDPRSAVLGIETGVSILARETESGGYKHKGSCLITAEMVEQAKGLSPSKLATLLKGAMHGLQ